MTDDLFDDIIAEVGSKQTAAHEQKEEARRIQKENAKTQDSLKVGALQEDGSVYIPKSSDRFWRAFDASVQVGDNVEVLAASFQMPVETIKLLKDSEQYRIFRHMQRSDTILHEQEMVRRAQRLQINSVSRLDASINGMSPADLIKTAQFAMTMPVRREEEQVGGQVVIDMTEGFMAASAQYNVGKAISEESRIEAVTPNLISQTLGIDMAQREKDAKDAEMKIIDSDAAAKATVDQILGVANVR